MVDEASARRLVAAGALWQSPEPWPVQRGLQTVRAFGSLAQEEQGVAPALEQVPVGSDDLAWPLPKAWA